MSGRAWNRILPPTRLERDLTWQCVLSAFATGTFLTGTAVYFTRIVGLSGADVTADEVREGGRGAHEAPLARWGTKSASPSVTPERSRGA